MKMDFSSVPVWLELGCKVVVQNKYCTM
jgi:hypothetical protein